MLQWMGGSRRKVTTSRKSTHKRQRQYFEQRKRQQQQESTWKDDSSDMINTSTQRPTNYQSLDILSMLDLSTSAQEHRSTCNSAKESLDCDILTLDCQATPELSKSHASQVAPADRTECRGESYQWKTVYPEKASMTFSGSHHKDLSESAKVEQLEMPNNSQLSVLDLLCDDGPNINLEGSSLHEAHVAFSVEGLGKVEMQTPEHSPQQPVRRFPLVSSTSSRGRVKIPSLKKFTSGQDDLAAEADCLSEDDEFSLCKSDIPPRCMMDSFSYSKQKNLMNKGCLKIVDNGPHSKNGVGDEFTFNNENKNDQIWADLYSYENHIEDDYASQYVTMNTNRECEKEMNTYDIIDPVTPYGKHQILENHLDLTNPDGTCLRCPDLGRTSVTRSVNNQPAWSCFKTEDEREILSFLSEESCPSNAVWDKAIRNPPSDSLGKNIRAYGSESCYPARRKGLKNMYSHGTHCTEQDNLRCRDQLHELGYSPTPAASFQKRKSPQKNWLFEHEDVTGIVNSGESLCHTFGVKETQPSTFLHWNEDLYDVDSASNIQVDAKLFSESSLGDFETRHSPFCSDKEAHCSSSAIWDEAVKNPTPDYLGKKIGQDSSECYCPLRKKGARNIFSHETYCTEQDNIHESGNCPTATVNFQKRKGPHESSLFEYEDTTAKRNSGLGTFNHISEVKDSRPSSFQHWNEDLYNVDSVPKIQVDAKLSSENSWSDFHTEHSSLFSERLACCELKHHKHSSETNFLPETSSRSIQSTVSPVFDVGGDPQYPFRNIVSHGDIPVCERDCPNREKKLDILKANSDKAELHEDACDGSNCLSSENKYSGDALDAGDSCSHFDVTEDRTQDMEGLTETCSPEQEEYVSSIKGSNAADKIESDLGGKEEDNIVFGIQKNDQTHLSQKRFKDIVKSRPKEGNMGSKTQTISNSVSRVMMCESYVLQYLSVHVLKKAPNWGIGNKKLQGT